MMRRKKENAQEEKVVNFRHTHRPSYVCDDGVMALQCKCL